MALDLNKKDIELDDFDFEEDEFDFDNEPNNLGEQEVNKVEEPVIEDVKVESVKVKGSKKKEPKVKEEKTSKSKKEAKVKEEKVKEEKTSKSKKEAKVKEAESIKDSKEVQDIDITLLVLTDRYNDNLLKYFRGCGLNVDRIYRDIKQLKNALLFSMNTIRVMVIDTGLGKFTSLSGREELMDLLGMVDNDSCRISVYYTDKISLNEAKDSINFNWKDINWERYFSTASVVANALKVGIKNKEHYISNREIEEDESENILENKGIELIHRRKSEMGFTKPAYDIDIIQQNLYSSNYKSLEEFNVKY